LSNPDDTFLGRWSRKKRAPQIEAVDETPVAPVDPPEELSDEEILERLDLPDPDQLTAGDDFKAFMTSAVPDHLRKRALRKLWLSNPALANLDGLVDYGEDFTDAAMVPEVLNTAYKVGRGFLDDIMDDAPQDQSGEVAEIESPAETEADDASDDIAMTSDTSEPDADGDMAELDAMPELPQAQEAAHIPRTRMVFTTG